MAATNIEFRVGLVILIGLIILAASLYWLEGYRLEQDRQIITLRFDDVGTLAVGDRVTVSGVRKGKVNQLRLTENGVLVELSLSGDVILNRDATFTIKNFGLMGERFVAISPGTDSVRLAQNEVIDGDYDPGLPEVMGLMGEMIVDLRTLVASFKQSIGSDSSLAKFNRTVDNLEQVSGSLAGYLDRNEGKLDKAADNFFHASRQFRNMLEDNAKVIDSSTNRFDRVTIRLEQFVERLDSLSIAARQFAEVLNSPDGTVQLLLEDRRLYDDLRQTADNIDDLINDIRANPKKYINMTVELF